MRSLCIKGLRDSFGLSPRTQFWKTPLSDNFQYYVLFPIREPCHVNIQYCIFATTQKQWVGNVLDSLACCFQASSHIAWTLFILQCGKILWCSLKSRGESSSILLKNSFIGSLTIPNVRNTPWSYEPQFFPTPPRPPLAAPPHFWVLSSPLVSFLFCNPESLVSVSCWNVGLSCLILCRWPQLLWVQWLCQAQKTALLPVLQLLSSFLFYPKTFSEAWDSGFLLSDFKGPTSSNLKTTH